MTAIARRLVPDDTQPLRPMTRTAPLEDTQPLRPRTLTRRDVRARRSPD